MEHPLGPAHRRLQRLPVPDIRDLHPQPLPVLLPQPGQIPLHARTRKIVVHQHGLSRRQQPVRQIRADKTRAARDQHMALSRPRRRSRGPLPHRLAHGLHAALRPHAEQQFRTPVRALQAVVILALVGVERIGCRALRVLRLLPVNALHRRAHGIHERLCLRFLVVPPCGKSSRRDPQLRPVPHAIERSADRRRFRLPALPRELRRARKTLHAHRVDVVQNPALLHHPQPAGIRRPERGQHRLLPPRPCPVRRPADHLAEHAPLRIQPRIPLV